MAITKNRDKRTGITYVYESESYWDKELKAPRNHKKLIGKIDEKTGEIVPTGRRGRPPKARQDAPEDKEGREDYRKLYEASVEQGRQKDQKILELRQGLAQAEKELREARQTLDRIRALLV